MVVSSSSLKVNNNDSTSIHSLGNDATLSMMDSARVGLDYIVENADYVQKLASALESKNFVLKKQVFELLSALCVYSCEGYGRALQALEHFKNETGARYRFKFVVTELRTGPSVEYQTAVLAFINCLILATPDISERVRIRSEFVGLRLLQELNDLRHKKLDYPDLTVQLDVFEEQKESDEAQLSPAASGIDLSSPLEVFDAILRQISDTPQEVPFLSILQHLLRIDPKEPISDLVWDSAERLVHRAILLESRDDALRLLKAPSHSKSMHKLKGSSGGDRCGCNCHKSDRKGSLSLSTGEHCSVLSPCSPTISSPSISSPPPPPPPPQNSTSSPPPPPPFSPGAPPPPPPPSQSSQSKSSRNNEPNHENIPKLPQQAIPQPKSKMRTVNWNKIPSGKIFGNPNNLWATFGRNKSSSKMSLDWAALEGLFCLQTEKANSGIDSAANGDNTKGSDIERRNLKRETNELTLLDAKRSLNINIFLKQFRSSNQEIVQLITLGSSEDFGSERLRGLLKILPSKDEMEMLKSVTPADKGRLGNAEKFLLQLMEIKGYALRIEAMLLKEELETCVSNLESSIHSILQASQDVKTSSELQEVIFMILVAGNFLNAGGYAGDAAGVKLSSLQKIADIRGNKPGVSLLHFVAMQAESRNPKLIKFENDMSALEEASKTSGEQLKGEILSLKAKVKNIRQQIESPSAPEEVVSQFAHFFEEATEQIKILESYLSKVEEVRVDLAGFFCEDTQSFKLEDCFKILFMFLSKWKQAAGDNNKRKKQEQEAEARRKAREEQLKKRVQIGWQNQQLGEDTIEKNKAALSPEDEIFIACSPRIVRRRLGSFSDNPHSGHSSNDQLALPSPDTTPNGSLRRRRSRVPSDEDETGLMDYLRSSGGDGRERKLGGEQYGSLDRSWSRKTRRRPNLMDFVNNERERPVSPGVANNELKPNAGSSATPTDNYSSEDKSEHPTREWRDRIAAWFVDLESGNGESQKRRPPPRRFQRRLGTDIRGDPGSRGLATLPEGDVGQEEASNAAAATYQRVYPDRKPSLKLNTDIVGTMEAIEEVQSPTKEKSLWRRPSLTLIEKNGDSNMKTGEFSLNTNENRRSLIGALGSKSEDDSLTLYIPDDSLSTRNSLNQRRMSTGKVDKPERSLDKISAGTKEGFDRFASIRRSRRYKREPEPSSTLNLLDDVSVSISQQAPPSTKFVTKVDLSSGAESNKAPLLSSSDGGTPKIGKPRSLRVPVTNLRQRNDTRSMSMIHPQHVHLALSSQTTEDDKNKSIGVELPRSTAIKITPDTTQTIQFAVPTGDNCTSLSSGKLFNTGSGENDEGFEESQSSLSETNSQTDGCNNSVNRDMRTRTKASGGGENYTNSLFSTSRNAIPRTQKGQKTADSTTVKVILPEGLPRGSNNNKNSSRSSLLSSRSSLTSQTTINTVRDSNDSKVRGDPQSTEVIVPSSFANNGSSKKYLGVSSTPSSVGTKGGSMLGKSLRTSSLRSEKSHPSPHIKGSYEKPSSKTLTPRLLSFMRPTASSSAKDKVEPPKQKLTSKKYLK